MSDEEILAPFQSSTQRPMRMRGLPVVSDASESDLLLSFLEKDGSLEGANDDDDLFDADQVRLFL